MRGPVARWRAWQDRKEAAAVAATEEAHAAWLARQPVDEVYDWAAGEEGLPSAADIRREEAQIRRWAACQDRLRKQATE